MAERNQIFEYTGINNNGVRCKGILQAEDIKSAELELKNRSIEIITLDIQKKSQFQFTWSRKKIKQKEIVLFTRFLSTMLSAGMPILKALDVIVRDQTNPYLQATINSMRASIASGLNFSQALRQHPEYFPPLYCSLVSAGEASSTLDIVLSRLAKYLEKIELLKTKVRNALVYPVAIVLVATAVSLILLIFVIPQFQSMFKTANVPLPYFTLLVIRLSDFIRHFWWLIVLTLGFVIWGFKRIRKNNLWFSEFIDKFSLKIIIIGPIIKKAIIARFTRTLSITLEAGLPLVESMKSMVGIMNNTVFSKGIEKICDGITSGRELSTSMAETKLFPNMVIQMVAIGEASGKLEEMLNNIANYYEEDVNSIAEGLTSLMEPIIIVTLGIIIGCFVIAMYLPIFKLGSTV